MEPSPRRRFSISASRLRPPKLRGSRPPTRASSTVRSISPMSSERPAPAEHVGRGRASAAALHVARVAARRAEPEAGPAGVKRARAELRCCAEAAVLVLRVQQVALGALRRGGCSRDGRQRKHEREGDGAGHDRGGRALPAHLEAAPVAGERTQECRAEQKAEHHVARPHGRRCTAATCPRSRCTCRSPGAPRTSIGRCPSRHQIADRPPRTRQQARTGWARGREAGGRARRRQRPPLPSRPSARRSRGPGRGRCSTRSRSPRPPRSPAPRPARSRRRARCRWSASRSGRPRRRAARPPPAPRALPPPRAPARAAARARTTRSRPRGRERAATSEDSCQLMARAPLRY